MECPETNLPAFKMSGNIFLILWYIEHVINWDSRGFDYIEIDDRLNA